MGATGLGQSCGHLLNRSKRPERDVSGLLDRGFYTSEASMCNRWRAGHGNSLHYPGRRRLQSIGGTDTRLAHQLPGKPAAEARGTAFIRGWSNRGCTKRTAVSGGMLKSVSRRSRHNARGAHTEQNSTLLQYNRVECVVGGAQRMRTFTSHPVQGTVNFGLGPAPYSLKAADSSHPEWPDLTVTFEVSEQLPGALRCEWKRAWETDFVNEKCSGASRRLEREKDGSPFIGWVHREGGYGVSRDTGALAPPTMVSEQQNQGWEGPSLGRMGFSVVASLTLGRAKDIGTAVCVSPVMTEGKLPPALQERALTKDEEGPGILETQEATGASGVQMPPGHCLRVSAQAVSSALGTPPIPFLAQADLSLKNSGLERREQVGSGVGEISKIGRALLTL
ncbi:hypothetical protein Cadr_000018065 [Camelus dromedarius]|uniref:Uncharacterized protein n=1 Tax=Camelus dromedarius TaxID=9838 RepID=A0A5N4D7J0_CAMDR|nr:hypothetical protein Cadr_000018065 [Camelus dromedarius]